MSSVGPNMFTPTGKVAARLRAALGWIVVHFSILEWEIEQTIWLMRKNPRKVGRQYTRRKQFHKRVDALEREIERRFTNLGTEEAQFYAAAIVLARQLGTRRNLVVHGLWSKGTIRGKRQKYFVVSYYDNESGDSWEVDEAALRTLNNRLVALINLLERGAPRYLGSGLP